MELACGFGTVVVAAIAFLLGLAWVASKTGPKEGYSHQKRQEIPAHDYSKRPAGVAIDRRTVKAAQKKNAKEGIPFDNGY